MKKLKLILIVMTLVFSSSLLFGCGKNAETKNDTNNKNEEKSIAKILSEQFKADIKGEKDIEIVANKISKNEVLQIQMDVSTIENGSYVDGFQTEIKGFDKAVGIRPIIGSIPFIAYIFEVENAEKFSENLKSNADLRWNICTEADDMEVAVVDNYVFFVMSPESFES